MSQSTELPIERIVIEATDTLVFKPRMLTGLMKLRAPRLLSKGTTFSRRVLRADVITLENFYISRGYLEAQVADSFAVTSGNQVIIHLTVTQGRQFMLSEVSIVGNRLLSEGEILQFLGLKTEKPYNPVQVRARLEALRHDYQDRGKLTIDILEEIEIDEEVYLRLTISEGLTYKIGNIMVVGLEKVPEWYVRRELLFQTGDKFNRSEILLSKQRVFESGLFGSVEIIPTLRGIEPGIADIEVRVRELERRSIDLSTGFRQTPPAAEGGNPNTALNAAIQWWHSRIFNTSVRTGLTLESNLNWESLWPPDMLIAWDIVTPWTLGFRIPTSIRLYSDFRAAPYMVWRNGVDLSFLSRRVKRSQLRGAIGWVFIQAGDDVPDSVKTAGAERSVKLDYMFQGVDNLLAPRRGTILQIKPSLHGTFIEDVQDVRLYYKIEVDVRRYHPIIGDVVFAYRFKAGYLETLPFGAARGLKSYQRYDLGGSTSLRGWATPLDFWRQGGIAKGLVNVELRTPLFWILGMEFFMDGGTLRVFTDEQEEVNLKWHSGWDIGMGLTLSTPLGPIRFDAAFRQGEAKSREPTFQVAFLHTF